MPDLVKTPKVFGSFQVDTSVPTSVVVLFVLCLKAYLHGML